MECDSPIRKGEIIQLAMNRIEMENVMQSKVKQKYKDNGCMILLFVVYKTEQWNWLCPVKINSIIYRTEKWNKGGARDLGIVVEEYWYVISDFVTKVM